MTDIARMSPFLTGPRLPADAHVSHLQLWHDVFEQFHFFGIEIALDFLLQHHEDVNGVFGLHEIEAALLGHWIGHLAEP